MRNLQLPFEAPLAGTVGVILLAVVGALTLGLATGDLPSLGGKGPNVGPAITPTPSNVVVIPPDAGPKVHGAIAYVKAGNIWVQSDGHANQLTATGTDSMPSFSPDGAFVYYIETHPDRGFYGCGGPSVAYSMDVPALMRIRADGSAPPEQLASGKFTTRGQSWFYFLRQPVVSPDGQTVALVSDAPAPCSNDVVVQLFDLTTRRLTTPHLPETPPLGHQDPTWSPDGRSLLFVVNSRSGGRGTPTIYRYVLATRKSTALTGAGYLQPAYSPDGRYVAVTHLDAFGSDVVILDATNGNEIHRVTNDDASAAPVWSPAGDAIAFLHTTSGITDLDEVTLTGTAPNWTLGEPTALTQLAGLDPGSRPSWFIPPDQLPTPSVP